ncbi:tyrosine-type recombinase/integrase [Rossellomorea vietnamensis]|uniref:tyrosine-type recombinase/integrase n=1 Tax=Rossellomorea vietnamensis TaxID=218284 RepID=UPI003D2AA6C2
MDYHQKIELYFELKGTPDSSRESYRRRMKAFVSFMEKQNKRLSDTTDEDIQQYILFLKQVKGLTPGTINNYISSIKFFYTYVLEKEWNPNKLPRMKRIKKFPVVPPREDVLRLLNSCRNIKHKAIFYLIYSSGLRVSEVAQLKIKDICSKSMSIRVDDAKHNTNRYTILSESALIVLREYFKASFKGRPFKPDDWLFPSSKNSSGHIHIKTIKNTIIKQRDKIELDTTISSHTLRHCFSTHSLEDGVDPVYIQQMLGHKNLNTTLGYLHMTSKSLMGVKSPLDNLGEDRR